MEIGVKESSKKKLASSAWAGHVEKNGRRKTGREQMPGKWGGGVEARKAEIASGIALKMT